MKFRHPLGGERGVQRRRPRPERDNRGGSGCDEDERDKGIDNIIEVKKKRKEESLTLAREGMWNNEPKMEVTRGGGWFERGKKVV